MVKSQDFLLLACESRKQKFYFPNRSKEVHMPSIYKEIGHGMNAVMENRYATIINDTTAAFWLPLLMKCFLK